MTSPDRSPKSRQRLYAAIEDALRQCPDLRVGQLIFNAVGDPFYVENDQLAEKIAQYVNKGQ